MQTDLLRDDRLEVIELTKQHNVVLNEVLGKFHLGFASRGFDRAYSAVLDLIQDDPLEEQQIIICVALLVLRSEVYSIPSVSMFPFLVELFERKQQKVALKLLYSWCDPRAQKQALLASSAQLLVDLSRLEVKPAMVAELKMICLDRLLQMSGGAMRDMSFQPGFLALAPEIMDVLEDEYYSFDMDLPLDNKPLWCPFKEIREEDRTQLLPALLSKACGVKLQPAEHQDLLLAVTQTREDLHAQYLSAGKFNGLVQNNPKLVSDLIGTLLRSGSAMRANTFFSELLLLPVNPEVIEVVQQLVQTVKSSLPVGFIQQFANHCMESCNQMRDLSQKDRTVRWVCVFLRNLVKEDAASLSSIFGTILSFCLTHPKIVDSVPLYGAIKALEG